MNYEVVTSYDVPTNTPITNPGFLKATGQECKSSTTFDSNIITEFLQTRIDPTTKGSSRPSFSCFVAVSDLTYGPADLDIVNLASPKVKQGTNLTYVATTTNFGPSGAQGVAISNSIPAGTMYLSSSLCSLSGGCQHPMQFGGGDGYLQGGQHGQVRIGVHAGDCEGDRQPGYRPERQGHHHLHSTRIRTASRIVPGL